MNPNVSVHKNLHFQSLQMSLNYIGPKLSFTSLMFLCKALSLHEHMLHLITSNSFLGDLLGDCTLCIALLGKIKSTSLTAALHVRSRLSL